ncbi:MFS general substrate transporter [Rickenella mellea]|uniref:MFS general substrate transporter n=1 Tax=Rickenella mellea TaxID=50990 RepID=A0A4Y7Q3E4_9AGAM|nr:MFS general substrate transporter [Rickenella mellea]
MSSSSSTPDPDHDHDYDPFSKSSSPPTPPHDPSSSSSSSNAGLPTLPADSGDSREITAATTVNPISEKNNVHVVEHNVGGGDGGAPLHLLSTPRKILLLIIFCFAQYLDTFSSSALLASIPPISAALNISNNEAVWLISAYQLTFAALLLVSGRLTDLYSPKWLFVTGAAGMGASALGAGFVRNEVALIVLRAFMGIGASLTIPSALHLIVHLFPDPAGQAKAVAVFAGTGAIGNVTGLIIGAAFVSFASWPWVFYFIAIIGIGIAVPVGLLVPERYDRGEGHGAMRKMGRWAKVRRLDTFGVGTVTVALVLFIYAVTTGSIEGWGIAKVIAPLVLSIMLIAIFFVWEAWLPEEFASVPPKMWKYTNFSILIAVSLLTYTWWGSVQLLFSWLWQEVYGWSTILTAVHFLPIGVVSAPFMFTSGYFTQLFPLKYVMLCGQVLLLAGSILLPFANSPAHYWPLSFPAMCIGTAGNTIIFATVNIALFAATPPSVAGTVGADGRFPLRCYIPVGAIWNSSLQVGYAAGAAIITSIQTSVQARPGKGGPDGFEGRAAAFWFLCAMVGVQMLGVVVFMKNVPVGKGKKDGEGNEGEGRRVVEKETKDLESVATTVNGVTESASAS